MAAAEETFQRLVAQLDYPMFIATVAAGGERAGCLIGFATQCSIHPPRFLAGISDKNRTFRVARDADTMAIHLVPEDAGELAELFGGETGDEVDKFARCELARGARAACRCSTAARTGSSAASSSGSTSATTWGWCSSRSSPRRTRSSAQLGFHRAKRIEPGHEA